MNANTWTLAEQAEILRDAAEILAHVSHVQAHIAATGAVTPMRTLGHWEEMRLDQHDLLLWELREARTVATQWPTEADAPPPVGGLPGTDFCVPGLMHMADGECDCRIDEGD